MEWAGAVKDDRTGAYSTKVMTARSGSADESGRGEPPPGAASPSAALDPVSGNPVRIDRALSEVFGGRAYYFESEDTRRRFKAEPQKYSSAAPQPADRPRRRRECY